MLSAGKSISVWRAVLLRSEGAVETVASYLFPDGWVNLFTYGILRVHIFIGRKYLLVKGIRKELDLACVNEAKLLQE